MPALTADKLVNKEIFAGDKTVKGYNSAGRQIKTFSPGESIGIVYSYLNLSSLKVPVLMFYEDPNVLKNPYYVKITDGPFKASPEIKKTINKEKIAEEQEQLKDKGAFSFYIEKYGPYVLATILILAIIKKKL
jgi:hypothetical protein